MNSNHLELPLQVSVTLDVAAASSVSPVGVHEAECLFRHGLEQERRGGAWEFAIRFVDDEEIGRLHEIFLGDPAPTDIITFSYQPEERGGDIVISLETAGRSAAEAGWEVREELSFLLLHGLLHILGWNDQDDSSRERMLARQYDILATWKESVQSD